jgi:DNA-binding MarR family transcriptional regulator
MDTTLARPSEIPGPALETERGEARSTAALDLDILPELLGFHLRRAQLALQRRVVRAMAGSDVGSGLFGLLVLCGANPGLAQIDVAEQLIIDKASVVALVDRLEAQGWLVRRRSTRDRRRQGLYLTAEGEQGLARLKARMRACEDALQDVLDAEERRRLIGLLQRIRP